MNVLGPFRRSILKLARRLGYDIQRLREFGHDPVDDIVRLVGTDTPIVFDVGANIGQTTLRIRRSLPGAAIHAFEPSPKAFDQLIRHFGRSDSMELNNVAVGPISGTALFHENETSELSSLLRPRDWGCWKESMVPTIRLDNYCRDRRIRIIDVLKVDTQGFDLEVIKSAGSMLENINLIMMEIIFNKMYPHSATVGEIFEFLGDNGFQLVTFYETNHHNGLAYWCDALFRNMEFGEHKRVTAI